MKKVRVQDAIGMELCHDITEMNDKSFGKFIEICRENSPLKTFLFG